MRKVYLVVLFAAICHSAFSQSTIGLTGGLTLASLKAKQDGLSATTDAQAGFSAGFVFHHTISNNMAIQPQLLYTQKGGKQQDAMDSSSSLAVIFNYIELPVNILYTHPKFFIGGGPSFGYALNGKLRFSTAGANLSEDVEFDDNTNRFELGGNLTGGYNITPNVFVSVNYNFAFTSMSPKEEGTLLNRYFAFKLGVLLPQKRARERR